MQYFVLGLNGSEYHVKGRSHSCDFGYGTPFVVRATLTPLFSPQMGTDGLPHPVPLLGYIG